MAEIKQLIFCDNEFYNSVKTVLEEARKRVYRNIQNEMVFAYWEIGKMIVEKQCGAARANYGDELLKELAIQLTKDFGRGFDERNLRFIRQFYLVFPKRNALRTELSWTHYRLLMRVDDKNARNFYLNETINGNWSTRQLEREINTFSYQ